MIDLKNFIFEVIQKKNSSISRKLAKLCTVFGTKLYGHLWSKNYAAFV